ncbi:MAG: flagellar biosynthesis repressor FlbT [Proteobacteria bacterium]|nr:flagellar biosynthesis repressor FlbT [Pseudomonadota bacterium]
MALKLSLKPGEKIVINGAVIANGDRRTSLIIHNKAAILRERDIMQEEEANTPARRVYFPIMLMYLDEDGYDKYYETFVARITELMNAIQTPAILELCVQISKDVMAKNYYRAVMNCKKVIAFEEELLADVA